MIGALWTGISGLAGAQTALDNESNNIANVNTIGFKSSRISFADQMYQNNIGKGTQVLDAEKMYTQGSLKTTGVNYDVALSGDGFFAVSNTRGGGTAETFYTRAGNFRMGDSGTLQDTIGNEIQGWAMNSDPVVTTSNQNVSTFTNDYTKLLSSKIINYSNAVETITAKATDYGSTAQSDDSMIFSGYGLKTKSGKVSDVEELVKAYTTALQNLKSNPNSSSASAKAQTSHIDLPGNSTGVLPATWDSGVMSADGDEVYMWLDGNRISQAFLPADATGTLTAQEAGYVKTMKAFADKISAQPGLKAYVASSVAPYEASTDDLDVLKGTIKIESIVPGKSFTISSVVMVANKTEKPGSFAVDYAADAGKGAGALETIRNALNEAVSGKQTDVYTTASDMLLSTTTAENDFTYQIEIYSSSLEQIVTVPATPLTITNATSVDDIVLQINNLAPYTVATNTLPAYVKAYNINGNLVIRTLDSNFDVEFSGDLKRTTAGTTPAIAAGDIKRNADYSGREGAGAEFIEIKTKIDQTASKGSLQLRLDTLGISDSAFGDFSVDATGLITMTQDGAMFAVGQIAIAKFITNRGLEPVGNNLLSSTLASGEPIYNLNNDKTAEVQANTLELSTADLSESLVNLMVFQRAFEANSKSITTADTILNTLIQLKR
ncbi:MAG: flagellar hook-basal body complex protein [Arcobacteraceae bacterium]|jgi:flagellar hook protein FlgE|nr:flagellar hook-basal body complex protein [Arcobacteraceae bacterium]